MTAEAPVRQQPVRQPLVSIYIDRAQLVSDGSNIRADIDMALGSLSPQQMERFGKVLLDVIVSSATAWRSIQQQRAAKLDKAVISLQANGGRSPC